MRTVPRFAGWLYGDFNSWGYDDDAFGTQHGRGYGDGYGIGHGAGHGHVDGQGDGFGFSMSEDHGSGWANSDGEALPMSADDIQRTERILRCAGCIGEYECPIHGRRL